jgi:DNA gyrase subunit A
VSIDDDDRLIGVRFTDGSQHLMLSSAMGMAIRFDESSVRPMGRNARGVRGMGLREGDRVVVMNSLEPDANWDVLTVCERGYGKRTPASEYRAQSRAGLGLITIKVNERNGQVVSNLLVQPDYQLMVVTNKGKIIRTPVMGISTLGRNTQGVRIIRVGADERVVAVARMVDRDDEAVGEIAEVPDDSAEIRLDPADIEGADSDD